MAFLREGAVKDLVSRGPKLDDVVSWAEDFVVHDDVVPSPSIPDYVRGHGLTFPEFESLVRIHLGEAEDPHSEDILMRLLSELESIDMNENKNNDMKDSIRMPSFREIKEGENKKMNGDGPCWDGYEMVGTKKKDGKEVPNCVKKTNEGFINEDHHKECSDEVDMAKIQLKSIMADASELLQSLDQCEQLDAWVQSKIALAEDYITTVTKYMKYEEEKPAEELPLVPAGDDFAGPGPTVDAELDVMADDELSMMKMGGEEEPYGPEIEAPEEPIEEPEEDDLAVFSQPEEEEDMEIEDEMIGEEAMYPAVAYMRDIESEDEEEEDYIEECGVYEHHLDTKEEKIKFICKHDKSCKKENLEKLSSKEIDKKYLALEKKMGMSEQIIMPRMRSL